MFIVGDADLSEKDSKNVEDMMKGFRTQFRDKDIAVKPNQGSLKGQEYSTDITKLGEFIKKKTKK